MSEDLARVWGRDGAPALMAVLDEHLTTLGTGRLPPRPELRMLLFAYGAHPAYDPRWTALLDS